MRQFTRTEIQERLRAHIEAKEPIVMGGAGIGLVAKVADQAGIDIIMAYNTGPFRMDGHPSLAGFLALADANGIVLDLGRRILPVVNDTPVVAAVLAGDPTRDMGHLITEMMNMGFSGITAGPMARVYTGKFLDLIEEGDMGYTKEVELIRICHERDIFTVAYVFSPEEAREMTEAGADIVAPHVYTTSGGMAGVKSVLSLDYACELTEAMCVAAREIRPDVILVSHGGPFKDPESVQYCFDHTTVHGYLGASSVERIPIENAITNVVKEYKALKLN